MTTATDKKPRQKPKQEAPSYSYFVPPPLVAAYEDRIMEPLGNLIGEHHSYTVEDLLEAVRDGHLHLIAIQEGAELAGFGIVQVLPDPKMRWVNIAHIWIEEEFRNRGHHEAFARFVESWARSLGARAIKFQAAKDDGWVEIGQKLGYEPVSTQYMKEIK